MISGFRSPFWHNRRRNRLTLDDILSSCGQELDLRTIEFFFFSILNDDEETTLSLVLLCVRIMRSEREIALFVYDY